MRSVCVGWVAKAISGEKRLQTQVPGPQSWGEKGLGGLHSENEIWLGLLILILLMVPYYFTACQVKFHGLFIALDR